MRTIIALPAPAVPLKPRVKNYLIKGIIFLTSEKFTIFVGVIAALICYAGVLMEDMRVIGGGALTLTVGLTPYMTRETARDARRNR